MLMHKIFFRMSCLYIQKEPYILVKKNNFRKKIHRLTLPDFFDLIEKAIKINFDSIIQFTILLKDE